MWQTKYAAAIPKNLGFGLNFRPCSEGYFLSVCPQFVLKRNIKMQCMRQVIRIKFLENKCTYIVATQFFFFEFHILNTKLGRRKSSDYKSTMARLLSQTLYSSPAVIRNAWHYISQFNQIEIVGNKEDKGREMIFLA